ncbi:MAG: hypothetical protein L3K08_07845, partial [Thermoplasmata archaeon]|nr:hypothetical protein [Thermoplasmata archaeon]
MAERPTGRRPAWGLRLSALLAALPIVGLGLASSHGIWVGLGVAAAGLFVTLALTVPKLVAGRRW